MKIKLDLQSIRSQTIIDDGSLKEYVYEDKEASMMITILIWKCDGSGKYIIPLDDEAKEHIADAERLWRRLERVREWLSENKPIF